MTSNINPDHRPHFVASAVELHCSGPSVPILRVSMIYEHDRSYQPTHLQFDQGLHHTITESLDTGYIDRENYGHTAQVYTVI